MRAPVVRDRGDEGPERPERCDRPRHRRAPPVEHGLCLRGAADDRGAAGHLSRPGPATASSSTWAASATRSCSRRSSSRRSGRSRRAARSICEFLRRHKRQPDPGPSTASPATRSASSGTSFGRSRESAPRAPLARWSCRSTALPRRSATRTPTSSTACQASRRRRREDRRDAAQESRSVRRAGGDPKPGAPPSDELRRLAVDLLAEMGIRRPDAGRRGEAVGGRPAAAHCRGRRHGILQAVTSG